MDYADRAVQKIVEDILDRSMIGPALEKIPLGKIQEIRKIWADIIRAEGINQ